VTVRIERAYAAQLKGSLRSRIDSFLKSTGLGLSLGAFGVSAALHTEPRSDPLPALHALLDLPLRLEAGGGYRALVVFDEFQDVARVEAMDAVLRSHIQLQGDVASYVFAGSEPGLMRRLFEETERPLYGQAVPMRLGRLPDADIAAYVSDRFRGTERGVGEGLGPLLTTAQGHPQRSMLLAHRLWDEVARGEDATGGEWEGALDRALVELGPEFEARWQRMTTPEQKTVRSLLEGRGSTYRTDVLARLGLSKSSAQSALQSLAGRAEVEAAGKGYALVDPLFGLWIERLGREDSVP
jgi:uncharacterized protein